MAQKPEEETLSSVEALTHIRTLARAALNNDDAEMARKHLEMILTLVNKALPVRRKPAS